MTVLVDTSVWSLALRRSRRTKSDDELLTASLASLIEDGRVLMLGAIRQELLSGIKEPTQFERLRDHLRAFPDFDVTSEDHENAASFYNRCRDKGIQGSNTDFLICAIAVARDFEIFTTDQDFAHFRKVLPIVLYRPAQQV